MKYPDTHDAMHRDANALLPWWVNGTLDASERAMVAHHLESCADCRREATQLQKMQTLLQSEEADVAETLALNRLRSRIEASRTRTPWWQHALGRWRNADHWVRFALVLQAGLITGLLLVLASPHEIASSYRTLSAVPEPAMPHAYVTVIFNEAVPERDIRALLLSLHASVVAGPTSDGAYVLALDPQQLRSALALLHEQPRHMVVFAEPSPSPEPKDQMP